MGLFGTVSASPSKQTEIDNVWPNDSVLQGYEEVRLHLNKEAEQ